MHQPPLQKKGLLGNILYQHLHCNKQNKGGLESTQTHRSEDFKFPYALPKLFLYISRQIKKYITCHTEAICQIPRPCHFNVGSSNKGLLEVILSYFVHTPRILEQITPNKQTTLFWAKAFLTINSAHLS